MFDLIKSNKLLSTAVVAVLTIVGVNFGVSPEIVTTIFSIAG